MKSLNLSESFMDEIRNNVRFNIRGKLREINEKYENFCEIFKGYLKSNSFKRLFNLIKRKYDITYQKLFLRHSLNFLNVYIKENEPSTVDYDKKSLKQLEELIS